MATTEHERGKGGGRALCAIVVAPDLSALRGPVSGMHRLPLHLDSSAPTSYNFADPHCRALAYRVVLVEASAEGDVTTWLDEVALIEAWPDLYLPRPVRRAWEARHLSWPVAALDPTSALRERGQRYRSA